MGPFRGWPRLRNFDYAAERTYFITFNVVERKPVFRESAFAEIARDVVLYFRSRLWYRLYAYVVMPDHLHLVVKPVGSNRTLSTIVTAVKNEINRRLRRFGKRVAWQVGFHDRIRRDHEDVAEMVSYVLRNPVRRGLAAELGSYPYSGAPDRWK